MRCLEGKVALVTGASRGIGRAIALALADLGAQLYIHCCQQSEKARQVAQLCGPSSSWLQADLSHAQGRQQLLEQLPESLDILIHNAGLTYRVDWDRLPEEQLDSMWSLHVKAPLYLTAALSPRIRERGRVVLITSHLTEVATQDELGYALSKTAQAALVKPLAARLGRRGITVNAVSPGTIETDMESGQNLQEVIWQQCLGRLGQPGDIAQAVAFLCSPQAEWITGQTLSVEGGFGL